MFKSAIATLLISSTQATSNSPVLNSNEAYIQGGSADNLISPEPKDLIATDTTTTANINMLGGWKAEQVPSDADESMFVAWKPQILEFVGMTSTPYSKFKPLTYRTQVVAGTNYRVVYDVSPSTTDEQHLTVEVFVPLPISGSNAVPKVVSVILPNGVLQISQGSSSGNDNVPCGLMGGESCWKPKTGPLSADMKAQFIGYQAIIESFHGSADYGTEFEPIKYKTQVTSGVTYIVQYKVKTGTVQATVYVPAVKKTGTGGKVTSVNEPAEVTQFVDEKGVVTNGAYKLGASIMMMASVIASVALA